MNTYKAINNILVSFIHDKPPILPENLDYNKLYELSKAHNIDGIVGYVSDKYNCFEDSPIKQKLSLSYINALTINTNKTYLFDVLSKQLAKKNIDVITFKGYCVKKLYPVPELRAFSDVDILIKESDRQRVHDNMLNSDFKCEVDYGNVYNYRKGIEYYEFHTTLISEDVLESEKLYDYFYSAFEHVKKASGNVKEFEDEFHLIYLISHIAKHIYYGGAGIRMYLDIALFVKEKSETFDFDHFLNTTKQLEFDKFACTVIKASCEWFSVNIPAVIDNAVSIDNETMTALYSFTLDKGIFGNTMSSSGEATVQLMKKKGSKHPKLASAISLVFPSMNTMKLKYAYLNKAPFLLPFAWIHRFFSNLGKIKSRKQKLHDIIATDNNNVSKHQTLLKNIGL